MSTPPSGFVLRDLPLSARIVLAAFLISVGVGYFSALIQLHFQHASAGQLLPGPEEAIEAYHGKPTMSQLERLLLADEHKPFNGTGSMAAAFTSKGGMSSAVRRLAEEKSIDKEVAEKEVLAQRDGERLALVHWLREGANKEAYESDCYPLIGELAKQPITEKYVMENDKGQRCAMIQSILGDRCARCHNVGYSGSPGNFPLENYEDILVYSAPETNGAMSLPKLAQSTHVHLLGFSMLYGLTGLIFALSTYPTWLRIVVAPLPLIAQVADISCWWLGRVDPLFAQAIVVTGGLVGLGLALHIVLGLFNLFGKVGKVAIVLLLIAGAATVFVVKQQVVDPHLQHEATLKTAKG